LRFAGKVVDVKKLLKAIQKTGIKWLWKTQYMPYLFVIVREDCDSDDDDE
jgi:hypothetical protein